MVKASSRPFAASHSNLRAVCGHPRNLTDDMFRALVDRGGIAGFNFCRDFVREDGVVSIQNVVWTPLVNHTEEGAFSVYALKDYTPELAAQHTLLSQLDDPIGQLGALTRQVIGEEFPIDA